jgi:hypothetical protein
VSAPATHLPELKSKLSTLEIPNLARAVGFGGLLGVLIVYLLYLKYPQLLIGGTTINHALIFGLAFGCSAHRIVEFLLINPLTKLLYDFAAYRFNIAELRRQRRRGDITEAEFKSIKSELDDRYFLGDGRKSNRRIETGE